MNSDVTNGQRSCQTRPASPGTTQCKEREQYAGSATDAVRSATNPATRDGRPRASAALEAAAPRVRVATAASGVASALLRLRAALGAGLATTRRAVVRAFALPLCTCARPTPKVEVFDDGVIEAHCLTCGRAISARRPDV